MYGVPLPPQATAPGPPASQGVPTQAQAPQWGGQGYQNQYLQQRQQMQQQLMNAPMPGGAAPQGAPQQPPGMAQGGKIDIHVMRGPGTLEENAVQAQKTAEQTGKSNYADYLGAIYSMQKRRNDWEREDQAAAIKATDPDYDPDARTPMYAQGGMMTMPAQAMMPPRQGALNYASGGSTGMQNVPQVPLSSLPQGNPQGRALVAQAPHTASPLGQNGTPTGALQPINYSAVMNDQPTAAQIPDVMRQRGIFTADSTPQYLSAGNTGTPRTVQAQLGPQGQSASSAAPSYTPDTSIQQQIEAILHPGFAEGGDVDFTGGGQPIDYSAGRKRDTIPAFVEHGEYVFTRKAVRGLGGGSIEQGGKKMGALMRHFESLDK